MQREQVVSGSKGWVMSEVSSSFRVGTNQRRSKSGDDRDLRDSARGEEIQLMLKN